MWAKAIEQNGFAVKMECFQQGFDPLWKCIEKKRFNLSKHQN